MHHATDEKPLTLFDVLAAIFRYKWRFMFVTMLVFVMLIGAILLIPKRYESEATLFVRLGRGSASLDPATVGQTISIQESRESELNSIVAMLTSRGLAEHVVDEVGVDRLNERFAWIELQLENIAAQVSAILPEDSSIVPTGSDDTLSGDALKKRKEWEQAVSALQGDLKVSLAKKSTTINITVRAQTPELARDIVRTVIDEYQKMHILAYRSGGSFDFFDQQFEEQEELLIASEKLLRKTKNENGILTLPGGQAALENELSNIRQIQRTALAELNGAKAKLDEIEMRAGSMPEEIMASTTGGVASRSTDTMRARLYELELEENRLSAKYSASYPTLMKVREQLRDARKIMAEQPTERQENTRAFNPILITAENERLVAQSEVASLEAKVKSLEKLEADLLVRLEALNDLEVVSLDLQRKIDIGREKFQQYARKREESRINVALDSDAISNVSVVAEPNARYKKVSPNRMLLATLALMLSTSCGLAFALLSDFAAYRRQQRAFLDQGTTNAESKKKSPVDPIVRESITYKSITSADGYSAAQRSSEKSPAELDEEWVEDLENGETSKVKVK